MSANCLGLEVFEALVHFLTKPSSAPPVIYEFNLWVRLKTKHMC